MEDDHDDHGDEEDHDDHGDDDHDDHGDHDEHDHGDHEMLMPEDSLEASSDCPTGTVISVYHFEAGEYMLEFEGEDVETFMMAIAAMGGAHHHHHDHGDDDHDDHDDHSDDEMVCYDMSTHTVDSSITTEEDCDAAGLMWTAANSGPGGDDDHDDHDDHGEHDEDMHAEDLMAMFDSNSDGYLSLEEFMEGMESMEDEDDHDDHDDHGDEEHICHNTVTHANTNDSEESCGAYTYLENHTMDNQTFTGCYNTMTHQVTWDNESACGAYMWMDPSGHGHDDHDFQHEFEEAFFGHYFNEADADGDGLLDMTELETLADNMNNMEGDVEMDLMIEIYMSIFDEDEDGVLSVEEFTEMMEMMMSMDEDDHDHGDHDEDEMVCYDMSTHTVDSSITTEEDCDAAGLMWTAANSGPGGDDDHDEDHGDEMNMTAMAEMMFAMFDTNEDGSLDESEVHAMMEGMMGEEHEEGVAFIGLHIEEEGEYGIALPAGVELHVLMAGEDEGDDHGSHDGHDDHTGHDDHGDEDDHDDHAEEELAYDPHSWLDPVAMAAQADVVLAKLIEVFPDGEDVFTENANAFKAELVALDDKFKTLTSTCSDRTVAANHNAYSYLAYRYDIEFVTVHGLDPEGEPSAEDVVEVVEHIEEEGITVLFVEEFTDQSSVQSIVDETGVSIQILYTMEMAPSDSSDDYLSMMNKNFESLEAGMSCSA
jgi:ABC-type Zn uptake system ZnuABC Zn-binding protein ZnuA/Ca2+-binding EF-hand superfamily protein